MYSQKIALALAPLLLLARADLQLDSDDVPSACTAICAPIVELTRNCEVDLSGNDDTDRNENRLEAQCVCTNDSFNVSRIAALCADCMRQHVNDNNDNDDDDDDNDNDDGDLEDINDIMYTCGFASTTYASSASTAADSVTVEATAPTALSQLTTTIVAGATNTGRQVTSSTSSSPSSSGSGSAATDTEATSSGTETTASASASNSDDSGTSASGTGTDNAATSTSATDNAAPTMARVGAAGAAVVGAFMMLA